MEAFVVYFVYAILIFCSIITLLLVGSYCMKMKASPSPDSPSPASSSFVSPDSSSPVSGGYKEIPLIAKLMGLDPLPGDDLGVYETSKGEENVAQIRLDVDKLEQQVCASEAVVDSGSGVDDKEISYLTEMLMRQLLKLDGIEAEGQRKNSEKDGGLEAAIMQRFAECHEPIKKPFWKRCLDALKAPIGCVSVVEKRGSSTKDPRKLIERVNSLERFKIETETRLANISGDAPRVQRPLTRGEELRLRVRREIMEAHPEWFNENGTMKNPWLNESS